MSAPLTRPGPGCYWCHNNPTPEHTDAAIEGLQRSGIRAVFLHGAPNGAPAFDSPYYAAVSNVRIALSKHRTELERNYPRTARAFDALEDNWLQQFREFFDGITVDPRHARQISALLPAAPRGLHAERAFDSHVDIDDALAGLREAITLYMTPAPATSKRSPASRKN